MSHILKVATDGSAVEVLILRPKDGYSTGRRIYNYFKNNGHNMHEIEVIPGLHFTLVKIANAWNVGVDPEHMGQYIELIAKESTH